MKYIDNRLNAKIVKLEDANNNYTSENVEGALEEINSQIKNIEANGYDDTQVRQHINNIKTEIGTEELTTNSKNIKGSVNELNSQIKENLNKFTYFNVSEFGAKGDGLTDDTNAIQIAFNGSNKTIKFNNSTYKITSQINIEGENLILDGNGATIKATNTHGFNLKATAKNITIKNFNFDFTHVDGFSNACIVSEKLNETCGEYDSTCHIVIENCKFNGSVFGICLNSATNVVINNNKFYEHIFIPNDVAGGYAVLLQSCYNVKVLNNYNKGGINNRHFCYVSVDRSKSINYPCEFITIENNYVDFNNVLAKNGAECSIAIRESHHVVVRNNYLNGSFGGIYMGPDLVDNESSNILIDSNRFENIRQDSSKANRCCICIDGEYFTENVIVSNNYFNNVNIECFSVRNCKLLTFKNNYIKMNNVDFGVYHIYDNISDFLIDGDSIEGERDYNIYYTTGGITGRIINLKKDNNDKNNITEFVTNNQIVSTTRDIRREMQIYRDYDLSSAAIRKNFEGLINSVTFEEFGFTVKFNYINVETMDFTFIQSFGELATLQVREIDTANNAVSFNVKSYDDNVKVTKWKIYF